MLYEYRYRGTSAGLMATINGKEEKRWRIWLVVFVRTFSSFSSLNRGDELTRLGNRGVNSFT